MKAIAYLRVSMQEQGNSRLSLEAQRAAVEAITQAETQAAGRGGRNRQRRPRPESATYTSCGEEDKGIHPGCQTGPPIA